MKNICATCDKLVVDKVVKSDHNKTPEWLEKVDYVMDFIHSKKMECYEQKDTDYKMTIEMGKKNANKKILYWAANPLKKTDNPLKIKNAKEAYVGKELNRNSFSNYGIGILQARNSPIFS